MRSLVIALSLFVLITSARAQTNPYESTIRGFEQADLRNPPPINSILVIGSSTIVGWNSLAEALPRFNVLNRGFGGSVASDVLYFYPRIVTPYRPPLIIFYEGDNDLASGKSVDQVFADWTNFVGRVERDLPDTHILFVSVKPSPSRANILDRQRELNERVIEFNADNPKLLFADVFNAMLDDAGQPRPALYVSDRLHLSPTGYDVWESVIVPIVEGWAARYPVNVLKAERNGLLIDFGAPVSRSGEADPTVEHWNNITSAGSTDDAVLANLVTTAGVKSSVSLQMVSRFNGANENGTLNSTLFPESATRDSLFGNTETFGGLQNVTPIFKLRGLDPGAYRLSFYASRMGVNDNRQTRYTATGATTLFVDLNAANNIDTIATIDSIQPDASSEITIALTPGPNNNNANHFTYLGVLRVEPLAENGPVFLIDFGSGNSPTGIQAPPPGEVWNNLLVEIGTTNDGELTGLIATNGVRTDIALRMLSRFNGANENGTLLSTNFPATATQDSLFGNTETFNGLADIAPAFKLTGLNPDGLYTLTFFASRTGVSDNRETRYTVSGSSEAVAFLDPANDVENTAVVENARPTTDGEITIELAPGPNNNNANHFTYLGILKLDWVIAPARAPIFTGATTGTDGKLHLMLRGDPGVTWQVETSQDLKTWTRHSVITIESEPAPVIIDRAQPAGFVRARKL